MNIAVCTPRKRKHNYEPEVCDKMRKGMLCLRACGREEDYRRGLVEAHDDGQDRRQVWRQSDLSIRRHGHQRDRGYMQQLL